jgi:hypothetical protein
VPSGVGFEVGARTGGRLSDERFDTSGNPGSPPPTLRAEDRRGPLRVAFWGDAQRGIGDVAGPLSRAAREEGFDLVVQHGDLVSHGEAPYYGIVARAFRRAGFAGPLWVVPGNHDVEPDGVRDATEGRRVFEDRLGPRSWAGDVAKGERTVRVVGLDDAVAPPGDPELRVLASALDGLPAGTPPAGKPPAGKPPAGTPWILAIHRPPRALDRPGAPVVPGFEPLVRALEARPPIAVVSGHLHGDHDVTVAGVRYVVNANGGDLDGGLFRSPRPASVLVLEVPPDGPPTLRRVGLERDADWGVRLDQLLVRLWSDRRRVPWAPWALVALGVVLLALGIRRRPRLAAPRDPYA